MFVKLFAALLLFNYYSIAYANNYGTLKNVQFHRCYDGDTCTFSIPDLHPIIGERINVRLDGIDTPEVRGKCEKEKELARTAGTFLNGVLSRAKKIELKQVSRGKYFRIVATIWADGVNVNKLMVKEKHAVKYDTGKKGSWC